MPNIETRRVQRLAKERLESILIPLLDINAEEIRREWTAFARTRYGGMSSPIVDVAVGPFAETRRHGQTYRGFLDEEIVRDLLSDFRQAHFQNLRDANITVNDFEWDEYTNATSRATNSNPRCFIAIEIESRIDRKVILADIINTAALGRVGVIVAMSDKVLSIFCRLLLYQAFLVQAEKPAYKIGNVLIVSKQQFVEILDKYSYN